MAIFESQTQTKGTLLSSILNIKESKVASVFRIFWGQDWDMAILYLSMVVLCWRGYHNMTYISPQAQAKNKKSNCFSSISKFKNAMYLYYSDFWNIWRFLILLDYLIFIILTGTPGAILGFDQNKLTCHFFYFTHLDFRGVFKKNIMSGCLFRTPWSIFL